MCTFIFLFNTWNNVHMYVYVAEVLQNICAAIPYIDTLSKQNQQKVSKLKMYSKTCICSLLLGFPRLSGILLRSFDIDQTPKRR